MQSTSVPPNIAGGLFPPAAGQRSSGQEYGQQGNAASSSRAENPIDASQSKPASDAKKTSPQDQSPSSNQELNRAEQARLQELRQRDREVRAHEQAHVAAGGPYVQGGANLQMRLGPDGKFYAVGGEVSMDASKVPGDPEATLEKAQTLRRAALAPARPSAQDMQVAALAAKMILEASQELKQEEAEAEKNPLGQKISSSGVASEENPTQTENVPGVRARALNAYQQQAG